MRLLRFAKWPRRTARNWLFVGLAASAPLAFPGNAPAETIRIVALGASNTAPRQEIAAGRQTEQTVIGSTPEDSALGGAGRLRVPSPSLFSIMHYARPR